MPNYRFHRYVTGDAVESAAANVGNGQVAAFVSAPGSAGTLAAGDYVKSLYPDARTVALEPRQCATLFNGGQGQHRIEGIGDKMVTLIHNVYNTDLLMLINDEETVQGMEVIQSGTDALVDRLGVGSAEAQALRGKFGPSCICNIVGAVKTAKYLGLGPQDNVVTIATDSYDRYPSVSADLYQRHGGRPDLDTLETWAKAVFLGASIGEIIDLNRPGEHDRLQTMKLDLWTRFGYSRDFIERMASQTFWDDEFGKIEEIDLRSPKSADNCHNPRKSSLSSFWGFSGRGIALCHVRFPLFETNCWPRVSHFRAQQHTRRPQRGPAAALQP